MIISGFIVGGISLTIGPVWWLFWTGAGIAAIGGLSALFCGILADVILDEPRVLEEVVDYSAIGQEHPRIRGGAYGETTTKPTLPDPTEPMHG